MFDAVMNFNLGEDIDALRDTVRRFAQDEIAPRAAEIDASNEFPMDLWEKMGALGLHAIIWAILHIVLQSKKSAAQVPRLACPMAHIPISV
jgi:hypothetical protein